MAKRTVFVAMAAFERFGVYRAVEVPTHEFIVGVLNTVYHYGQNDFQPQHLCSVSAGDVILTDDEHGEAARYKVAMFGFEKMTDEQWQQELVEWEERSNRREAQRSR